MATEGTTTTDVSIRDRGAGENPMAHWPIEIDLSERAPPHWSRPETVDRAYTAKPNSWEHCVRFDQNGNIGSLTATGLSS